MAKSQNLQWEQAAKDEEAKKAAHRAHTEDCKGWADKGKDWISKLFRKRKEQKESRKWGSISQIPRTSFTIKSYVAKELLQKRSLEFWYGMLGEWSWDFMGVRVKLCFRGTNRSVGWNDTRSLMVVEFLDMS